MIPAPAPEADNAHLNLVVGAYNAGGLGGRQRHAGGMEKVPSGETCHRDRSNLGLERLRLIMPRPAVRRNTAP
jgi:hypothetical protein